MGAVSAFSEADKTTSETRSGASRFSVEAPDIGFPSVAHVFDGFKRLLWPDFALRIERSSGCSATASRFPRLEIKYYCVLRVVSEGKIFRYVAGERDTFLSSYQRLGTGTIEGDTLQSRPCRVVRSI